MGSRTLISCFLLSAIVLVLFSTVTQATEYREVKAEEILKQIENGEDVNYTDCRIVGELDVSKIKLETVPNPMYNVSSNAEWDTEGNFVSAIGIKENLSVVKSNINIENSIFENGINFSNTLLQNNVTFCGVLFNGFTDFKGTTFNGSANYEYTTFRDSANFRGVTFNGLADFYGTTFNDSADFPGAMFNGEDIFEEITFNGSASFNYATFKESVDFGETEFNDDADFPGVTFNGTADFRYVTFNGYANFYRTSYIGSAMFSSAYFNNVVDFSYATFKNSADFISTTYNDNADFSYATFCGSVNFADIFVDMEFDFPHNIFKKFADFSYTTFGGSVNFAGTIFNDSADFSYATFSGYLRGPDVSENIITEDESYEAFRKYYMNKASYEDADTISYNHRKFSQDKKDFTSLSKWSDIVSWITCGYGFRPFRILYSGVFIVGVFTLLYWQGKGIYRSSDIGENKSEVSFWDALYFSTSTFTTLGSTDWYPTDSFRKWVTLEGLLGWIMLGIFMATLTTVMIRV